MLHENLLQYRKMLRLSQEEIAERIGVSRQAYAKWEAGTTTPELKYCRMLADLFEITLDALVEERDLRREGPPGKYVLGVVAVDDNDCIRLPEKAMLLFGLRPGERLLLLGDEKQGLALVPYAQYEQFARHILNMGSMPSEFAAEPDDREQDTKQQRDGK